MFTLLVRLEKRLGWWRQQIDRLILLVKTSNDVYRPLMDLIFGCFKD